MTELAGTPHRRDLAVPALCQLSEHQFVLEDTCNVYVIRDDDAALVIDSGSGAVSEVFADLGVSLEWILHTHHHRDQCWGTPRLVADSGARVAVPEHERYLFESAREHWQTTEHRSRRLSRTSSFCRTA